MKNALTFDVEDWYQSTFDKSMNIRSVVVDQTSKVLDILGEFGVHATFFVQGLVAEKFPLIVKKIYDLGHEIGTHGYSHEFVFNQTPSEFTKDLKKSIVLLEDITGHKVIGYRAPDFSIIKSSLWALDVLEEMGIKYDSSIFPIKNSRYGIKDHNRFIHHIGHDGSLIEFPLSTVRLFGINFPVSGGGYFRLMPYPLIRLSISWINSNGSPAIVYMHPYEFDPNDLPILLGKYKGLSIRFQQFTQNINRSKSEAKLRKLLGHFTFTCVAEVLNIDR